MIEFLDIIYIVLVDRLCFFKDLRDREFGERIEVVVDIGRVGFIFVFRVGI